MTKFFKFCIVGGSGAVISWVLTWLITERIGLWYIASMIIATFVAMVWNFIWNSKWTFSQPSDVNSPDYEWKAYHQGNPIQKWWKKSIASTVWDWIPDESSLLNIGCGSSPIAMKYPYAVNIDMNHAKIEFMKRRIPTATFIEGDACDLRGLRSESFDHAICVELIEHVNYPERVVEEIARLLVKGGNVVIATPDYSRTMWHLVESFTPYKEWHGAKLTKAAIESMCRQNGLVPVKYKYIANCDLVEMFVKR